MRATGGTALVVAAAEALSECQSTQTRDGAERRGPSNDASLIVGRWEGRGDTYGARRRLEVDTDEDGYLGIEFRHHDAGEDARVRIEIVLAACTSTPKRRTFEVVTRRYLSLPVLITNKPFSERADVFSSAACVVTLVDRLIHRFEIVQLDGESYRLREAKEQAAKCSKARSRRSANSRASRLATIGTISPEHRCRLPSHCPQSVQYTRPDPPSTAMRTGLPTPRVTKSSTPEPSRLARRIDRAAESCQ